MMYKTKVAVFSEIRTKHSTQSEHHVEFFNVKPWWYVKKPLGFKRLTQTPEVQTDYLNKGSQACLRCQASWLNRGSTSY